MLQSTGLQFAYRQGERFSFPDVSATAERPLLLLGASGRGKTTLLHLLGGLLRPESGKIMVGNTDIAALPTAVLDHFRGSHIGIVFQQAHFVDSLSVLENLVLAQYLAGVKQDKFRAQTLLQRLDLAGKYHVKPSRLSVGQRQRAAIARALMCGPEVVLADEPTSALDDRNAAEVVALLRETTADAGAALVIVTHDQRVKDAVPGNIVTL